MSDSLAQFQNTLQEEALIILDTRNQEAFLQGFIPGSIHAPLDQLGKLIAMGQLSLESPIALIADAGTEEGMAQKMKALGFQSIKSVLKDGFQNWIEAGNKFDLIIEVEIDELAMDLPFDEFLMVLDIRNETSYHQGHIKNSLSIPLETFSDLGNFSELDDHFNIYIISENGEDSSVAASILKKQGIHNIRIVMGGWTSVQTLKDQFTIEKN